jgi:phage terminase small subunit
MAGRPLRYNSSMATNNPTSDRTLTPKQLRFVEEYLVDLNATQAAIRAGYSARNADKIGPELLGKTRVAAAIRTASVARTARVEVTQDYVVCRLQENVERALQHKPIRDRDGNPTGEYQYEGAVANGALKLLGLHLGMFKEVHEHSGPGGKPMQTETRNVNEPDLSGLTKDELLAIRDLHTRFNGASLPASGNGQPPVGGNGLV